MKKTEKQNVTRVFNLVILDASGSMFGIQAQALSNLNETIQTVRNAAKEYDGEQEHTISLVTFNTSAVNHIYDNVPALEAEELTMANYSPNGGTPLYDAMGQAMTMLEMKMKDGDRALVTIITDGYENASREYSQMEIRHMTERLRKKGWVIAYIGANQDVETVSRDLGIKHSMCFQASPAGTMVMAKRSTKAMKGLFHKLSECVTEEELDEDYFG